MTTLYDFIHAVVRFSTKHQPVRCYNRINYAFLFALKGVESWLRVRLNLYVKDYSVLTNPQLNGIT